MFGRRITSDEAFVSLWVGSRLSVSCSWNSMFTLLFKTSTLNATTLQCIPLPRVEHVKIKTYSGNELSELQLSRGPLWKEEVIPRALFLFVSFAGSVTHCKQCGDTNCVAFIVFAFWQNNQGQSAPVLLHSYSDWLTHWQTLIEDKHLYKIS